MGPLSYGDTILAMLLLGMLTALWGSYRELRRIATRETERH